MQITTEAYLVNIINLYQLSVLNALPNYTVINL